MDSHQRAAQELGIRFLGTPLQAALELGLDLFAQAERVAFTRHIDQTGIETGIAIAAHEQPQTLCFAHAEHAHDGVVQLLLGGLEQLVAGEGFQDVAQALGAVRTRAQRRSCRHVAHLLTQQRYLARAHGIGLARKKPQKTMGTDHVAHVVHALDGDHVHGFGVVDPRTPIGLGHHQNARRLTVFIQRRGRSDIAVGVDILTVFAQQAETGAGYIDHGVGVVFADLYFALAIAQQREVIVGEPAQKGLGLFAFVDIHAAGHGIELGHDLLQLPTHRLPVADNTGQVAEVATHPLGQRVAIEPRGGREFQAQQGFLIAVFGAVGRAANIGGHTLGVAADPQNGVHHPVDIRASLAYRHAHGIDDEGHVIGEHQQRGIAITFAAVQIAGNDREIALLARRAQQLELLADGRIQRLDGSGRQLVEGDALEPGVDEAQQQVAALGGFEAACPCPHICNYRGYCAHHPP